MHTLDGAVVEGHQQLLLQVVFPEDPEEVVSLLGPPDNNSGAGTTGVILGDVLDPGS